MVQVGSRCVSSRRPSFDPRPVHARFVVYGVALAQVLFLSICCCFPLSLSLHQYSVLVFVLSEGQAGEVWRNLKKAVLFSEIGNLRIENYFNVVAVRTAQFNIRQSHVLPTHCVYVFCVDLRTNSDYFPIQH
jgi:hypothetical protein